MDLGLENKVALVAGGSSGIGLAVATELAREGAHVAIAARGADQLQAAVRRLQEVARGGRITGTSLDLTDSAAARRWVDEVASDFGALHIVLVSGGSPPIGPAAGFQPSDYQAAVEKVLYPAVTLALAAVPHLRAAGWGRLLFVASETAVAPIGPLTLSGVTRAAVLRLAQGLAADLGRDGITVNVLAPGTTRTPPIERAAARMTPRRPTSRPPWQRSERIRRWAGWLSPRRSRRWRRSSPASARRSSPVRSTSSTAGPASSGPTCHT